MKDIFSSLPKPLKKREKELYKTTLQYLNKPNGNKERWEEVHNKLPHFEEIHSVLNQDTLSISSPQAHGIQAQLSELLLEFHPWRKGPFRLFDVFIDTEWRSDWKWQRLLPHISPLQNRNVLDVGCGSGYHCWRMRGAGARFVLGIDPSLLFLQQFRVFKRYLPKQPVYYLPLPLDEFPKNTQFFDTVFSMGVLYHRKDPFLHLENLKGTLKKGGELVLETLISKGPLHHCLVPKDRYAQMRNVWFLPSTQTIIHWLSKTGFKNIRLVDVNQTTIQEQRSTPWMHFHSLVNYLDPNDQNKTIEGLPAPIRAIFIASKG